MTCLSLAGGLAFHSTDHGIPLKGGGENRPFFDANHLVSLLPIVSFSDGYLTLFHRLMRM